MLQQLVQLRAGYNTVIGPAAPVVKYMQAQPGGRPVETIQYRCVRAAQNDTIPEGEASIAGQDTHEIGKLFIQLIQMDPFRMVMTSVPLIVKMDLRSRPKHILSTLNRHEIADPQFIRPCPLDRPFGG